MCKHLQGIQNQTTLTVVKWKERFWSTWWHTRTQELSFVSLFRVRSQADILDNHDKTNFLSKFNRKPSDLYNWCFPLHTPMLTFSQVSSLSTFKSKGCNIIVLSSKPSANISHVSSRYVLERLKTHTTPFIHFFLLHGKNETTNYYRKSLKEGT